MPSPFPGMDPFLESPDHFPCVHQNMVTFLQEMLQARLPEPYFAKSNERVWVEATERPIIPDVNVSRPSRAYDSDNGGVALLEPHAPLVITAEQEYVELREAWLDVFTRDGGRKRLVTTIEVLSPSNKNPGSPGRAKYVQKQQEVLASQANLIEIDLLRGGRHVTCVPEQRLAAEAGHFDYHVVVHRFDQPDKYHIYPMALADRLPEIAVPLLPNDGDVLLDLQLAFDRCYDAGPYRREIDYTTAPLIPPLEEGRESWARRLAAKVA